MERSGSTDCSTCSSTERPGPAMGKKREAESPIPGGDVPPLRSGALPLPQCVSLLNVAFPSPWRSFSFSERRQSRRFSLFNDMRERRPKVVQSDRGGNRDQAVFPTCLHFPPLYSHPPQSSLPCVGVCEGAGLYFSPCSRALRRGPGYGWSTGEECGWKDWGQGRVSESRVSDWTQC